MKKELDLNFKYLKQKVESKDKSKTIRTVKSVLETVTISQQPANRISIKRNIPSDCINILGRTLFRLIEGGILESSGNSYENNGRTRLSNQTYSLTKDGKKLTQYISKEI